MNTFSEDEGIDAKLLKRIMKDAEEGNDSKEDCDWQNTYWNIVLPSLVYER